MAEKIEYGAVHPFMLFLRHIISNSALTNYPCLFCPSDNLEHHLALPTRSRTSVRTLSYWYLLSGPRRCEMNRKVGTPRGVSASGVPHIVTWTKANMDKTSMHLSNTCAHLCCILKSQPLGNWRAGSRCAASRTPQRWRLSPGPTQRPSSDHHWPPGCSSRRGRKM